MDAAEAVAAKFEIVGHDAGTGVTEIEGGFAVEGGAGIGVGDVHVGEGEAVEEGAVVVSDVVEDHAFALVEAVAERPLLPVNCVTGLTRWGDSKAGAFGLNYIEGFDVGSQFLVFRSVFIALGIAEWAALFDLFACASWEAIDTNDLLGDGVHDGRNWQGGRHSDSHSGSSGLAGSRIYKKVWNIRLSSSSPSDPVILNSVFRYI